MEHTLYHFAIPQEGTGEKNIWKALEMFSTFFKCPLLGGEQAHRELNAVESEFEMNKMDDDTRLQQLMCFSCGMDGEAKIMGRNDNSGYGKFGDSMQQSENSFHPFAKFSWGNMQTLKVEPEANGIDVMKELKEYYHAHYFARNMRLVVMAGYELDEIQRRVVECFRDVPADPRIVIDNQSDPTLIPPTHLKPYQLPFHSTSLASIYRILPVRHCHSLTLTWQIPSICQHWRTKPHDFIAHLMGHEASGSILSTLKKRGWAMGCSAGTGEDGLGDASTHALFTFHVSLSKRGVRCWEEVVKVVFCYIGMLRYHFQEGYVDGKGKKTEGLPQWIYDELKSIANVSYRYADEGDVEEIVEEIAENMALWYGLPEERVLDGDELLFDDVVDNETVKDLLFNYLTPQNLRVDLMSSLFGRESNFDEAIKDQRKGNVGEKDEDCEDVDEGVIKPVHDHFEDDSEDEKETAFDTGKAGPPSIEPRFGTHYWKEKISTIIMQQWTDASKAQLPPAGFPLDLPPKNPFVPSQFDLKPLPTDDAAHPLVHCSVKVCVCVGKKKAWFPAVVTQYKMDGVHPKVLISYEDEDEKWHALDSPGNYEKFNAEDPLEPGFEGSLDKATFKFRVIGVPREGEGAVLRYGDADNDDDVEDGIAFPPIPPPSKNLPKLVYDNNSLKVWHLQDRKFKRPLGDLRIKVDCDGLNDSALNQACMNLFCRLCADALTETCYLASVCELGSSLYTTETGFGIRVHGFDHKLLELAKEVLALVMSFRGREGRSDLPPAIKEGRFDACLESLLRKYKNYGMNASSFCTGLRLLCLRPSHMTSNSKLKAIHGITIEKFVVTMNKILKRVSVEAFYHGNCDINDAKKASQIILGAMTSNCNHVGIPKTKIPAKLVVKTPLVVGQHSVTAPTLDPQDPNTAVEVYFQMGKDNLMNRVLVDMLVQVLDEPLFCQLRTHEGFGYEVSCSARWTYGIIGMSFKVVTASKSANEVSTRIDDFLRSFRSEIDSMDKDTYTEHLVGLAKNKLEMYDSLDEECSSHWSEIIEGRYDFDACRKEAHCLKSITKGKLIKAYDEWLNPECPKGNPKKRRRMVFQVIGSGDGPVSTGRPVVENWKAVGDEIDDLIKKFHQSVKNETWGRVTFDSR